MIMKHKGTYMYIKKPVQLFFNAERSYNRIITQKNPELRVVSISQSQSQVTPVGFHSRIEVT